MAFLSLARWGVAAFLLAMLTLSGCGSLRGESRPTPGAVIPTPTPEGKVLSLEISVTVLEGGAGPEQVPTRIEAVPREVSVVAGEQARLGAVVYDQQGQVMSDPTLVWSTLDPEAGFVGPGGMLRAGTLPGRYPNAVRVSAPAPRALAQVPSAPVTVQVLPGREPATIDRVRILPSPVVVQPRQILLLSALAETEEGLPVTAGYTWELTDPDLGRINSLGYLTATAPAGIYPNAVKVTARSGGEGVEAYATLQVVTTPPSGDILAVRILPEHVRLRPGQVFQFRSVALGSLGQPLSEVDLSWRVADPRAGVVDQTGSFRAGQEPGVYTDALRVTARHTSGNRTSVEETSASIVIHEPEPLPRLAEVAIQPKSTVVTSGNTVLFLARPRDERGLPLPPDNISWSLADPRVGTMEPNGLLRVTAEPGVYRAAVRVTAKQTVEGAAIWREALADVVVAGELQRIEVEPSAVTAEAGATLRLRARGYDGSDVEIPGLVVRWEMVEPRAGTVDQAGNFTAGPTPGHYRNAIRVTVRQPPLT